MTNEITEELLIEALQRSRGLITIAAKLLKVKMPLVRKMSLKPKVQDAIKELREAEVDNAELRLMERIDRRCLNSIMFFLRYKGKERGYVDTIQAPVSQDVVENYTTLMESISKLQENHKQKAKGKNKSTSTPQMISQIP